MAEAADIQHLANGKAEWGQAPTATSALAELEPFVCAVTSWLGQEAEAAGWSSFVEEAAAQRTEPGLPFQSDLPWLNHVVDAALGDAVVAVDWSDAPTAYSKCQWMARRLGVGRIPVRSPHFGPVHALSVFWEFDRLVRQHGMGSYLLSSEFDSFTLLVSARPDELETIAKDLNIRLERPAAEEWVELPEPLFPVDRSIAQLAVEAQLADIELLQEAATAASSPGDRPVSHERLLAERRLHLARLMYAAGAPFDAIQAELSAAVSFGLGALADPRSLGMDVTALCVLFELDELAARLGTHSSAHQRLHNEIESATALRQWRREEVEFVERITQDPGTAPATLEQFLSAWHDDLVCGLNWHDPQRAYLGQLAFEVAAVAKKNNVDDSHLHDHPLYPADLTSRR